MQQVTLNVSDEFKALGDALAVLISDIKAGKTVVQDLSDAVSGLIPVIGALSAMPADIKLVDNQVYLIKALATALEPVAAPAAPVA